LFIEKIKYLLNTDEGDWGITIAIDLVRSAQKEVKEYRERASQVKDEAGGNDVYVVSASEYSEFQQYKMKALEYELGMHGPREYTPEEKELMKLFWRYIHNDKAQKSKHTDTIGTLLEILAKEAESADNGRSEKAV
jgi:DICT domain-containing protein